MENKTELYKQLMCKLLGIKFDSNGFAVNDYDVEGEKPLYMEGRFLGMARFNTSLDWIRPVVMKCIKLGIRNENYTDQLDEGLLTLNLTLIFNTCGEFLENYYNQNSILEKMVNDKKAISKCIQEGGNLKQLSGELGIKFATPIK